MDRLASMLAFTRVVEAGSFIRAAESLDLHKATFTRLIQSLETHLGVKLLHRNPRRISVTVDGAAYYQRCVRILNEVEEAEHLLSEHNSHPRGTLRIETSNGLARTVLVPNIRHFIGAYPDLRLELTTNSKPIDLLEEGVDVVLRVGMALDEAMVARRIGEIQLAFYASPIYLRRFGSAPRDLTELQRHLAVNYFSGASGHDKPWTLIRSGDRNEVQMSSAVSTNDIDMFLGCTLDGLGIARMTRTMAEPYIHSGRLVEVMEGWQAEDLAIHAMYPQNRHLSAKVRAFIDWAADVFSQHAKSDGTPQPLAA